MFLRSIRIRGFKSFADTTTLDFIPGISVIVGPNGSGKSNLVDAIAWVLGEQGARALRGGQMADVIFAGTPSRPALGMAEVKLVIDNGEGKIPVPMSEIEISRAIYRSGESEYRINGQVVRLMDVQELLSESGIGRALHTVVGQGQLEEVLLARPEERRRYVEEAAGVAKHRRRKERAENKLASLEQDLVRLQDVLGELRRQLKPLRKQAETAKRHEALTAEAEELARRIAAARLRALLRERDRRSAGWDEGIKLRRAARRRLDELDTEVLEAADARARAARALADAEASLRAASRDREGAALAARDALTAEAAAREAIASQAARAARAEALDAEISRLEADLARVVADLEDRERALEAAERTFREAQDERQRVDEARRRIGEEAVGRRVELETVRATLSGAERDRARLDGQLEELESAIGELESERERLSADIERLDGQISPLAERRDRLEEERRTLAQRVEELEEAERRMQARRELLEARLADIEETPGTRFMSRHRGRAIGLLRDLVHAEPGLERALVAALGALADAVVYEEAERALEDARVGEGAILAIASGGPVPPGVRGERRLLSAVEAEPSARGIVSAVLRDVYLAEDLDEASAKQAEHPTASFVTPEGIVVGPVVIRTAAAADARVREIRAELDVVVHDLAGVRRQLEDRRVRLGELGEEAAFLQQQIEAADTDITASADRLFGLDRELDAKQRERASLRERRGAADEAVAAARARLGSLPAEPERLPELPPLPQPPVAPRVAVETLRRERGALDGRLAELRAERAGLAEHDPGELRAALEAAGSARERADRDLARASEVHAAAEGLRDELARADRAAAQREADVNGAWRAASTELERLRETYEEDDRVRGDIERRIREAERMIREGFGAEPDQLLSTLDDQDAVESLQKRAELVQRRLALLGRVNLLAGGEFEALQQRHDFLERELDDVRKARRDLLEVVARIDREITETFASAYADVAAQFERLIAELFPGGEGRLRLTDPSDPLASGIEIEASPGRKRVQRISLLSGGERSLTAMAFLFAIFTARPSPFYLMDEVEPALDDVNLHRFLRLVEGFAKQAQVIIVTHQKRTMEVAGMMYGVSLSGDGTSTVVWQRLEGSLEAAREQAREEAEHPSRPEVLEVPESETVGIPPIR
jgi:chromosome segregation protein